MIIVLMYFDYIANDDIAVDVVVVVVDGFVVVVVVVAAAAAVGVPLQYFSLLLMLLTL